MNLPLEANIQIRHKRVKHASIRIKPSQEVIVTVPLQMRERDIAEMLRSKEAWIQKHLQRFSAAVVPTLCDGEDVHYLGKTYRLSVVISDHERISLEDEQLFIFTRSPDDYDYKKGLLDTWYKVRARALFPAIMHHYQPLIDRPVNAMRIRSMSTRWGSCNHTKGYINLNLELIKKPREAIEYVVLHELAHLIHPNHSSAFYATIAEHMPDWKARKGLLTRKQ